MPLNIKQVAIHILCRIDALQNVDIKGPMLVLFSFSVSRPYVSAHFLWDTRYKVWSDEFNAISLGVICTHTSSVLMPQVIAAILL